MNYLGKGNYDNSFGPLDLLPNKFPAVAYVDVTADYTFDNNVQIYGKIENLLNKDPNLLAPTGIPRGGSADASNFYDLIGRVIGVGVRYRW